MKKAHYAAIGVIVIIIIIGGFLFLLTPSGSRQLDINPSAGSGIASLPYVTSAEARVVGDSIELTSEVGRLVITDGIGTIGPMDKTITNTQWRVGIYKLWIPTEPKDIDVEISGDKEFNGTLNQGEKKTFTTTIKPKERGAFTIGINGTVPDPVATERGGFCCGIHANIYVLYDGTSIQLARSQGDFCKAGIFDETTLSCRLGPAQAVRID